MGLLPIQGDADLLLSFWRAASHTLLRHVRPQPPPRCRRNPRNHLLAARLASGCVTGVSSLRWLLVLRWLDESVGVKQFTLPASSEFFCGRKPSEDFDGRQQVAVPFPSSPPLPSIHLAPPPAARHAHRRHYRRRHRGVRRRGDARVLPLAPQRVRDAALPELPAARHLGD